MNRYEHHQELEEAKKASYSSGYDAGYEIGTQRAKISSKTGEPQRFGKGKPVMEAEFVGLPNHDAYELRARLVIGDKWYAAKQLVDRETVVRLVAEAPKDADRYVALWLQGATQAIFAEFSKDIQYKMPDLPKRP